MHSSTPPQRRWKNDLGVAGCLASALVLMACGAPAPAPQASPLAEATASSSPSPPSSAALVALVRNASFDVVACRGIPDAPTLGGQYVAQVQLLGQPIHEGGRCVPAAEGPIEASEGAVWSCTVIATPADEHGQPFEDASNFSVVFELDAQGAIVESSPLCVAAG